MPNIPYNSSGAASPVAPPSQGRPQATQTPVPQLGSSYDTQAASKGAVAQSVVNSVIQMANQAKQKRQQDESLKAENYFSQLMTAAQNPSDPNNQKIIQILTSDPKIMKTIEKGLDYSFAQEPAKPTKPEPPEAKGLKAAVQRMFHGKPQPTSQPAAGQPGGIVLPGPTQAGQLQAAQQSAQLSGLQQSPELRQSVAGLRPTPAEEAKLDTAERIAAGKDFTSYQIELEKAKTAQTKADNDYAKQVLTNKGRFDATTSVARINAQARVESARIAAQASLMRAMGKAMKEPPVAIQTKWSAMNRAKSSLDVIMSGHSDQGSYNKFIEDLKQSGLSGIVGVVPGQSGVGGMKAMSGYFKSDEKWKTIQTGLNDSMKSFKDALTKTYPDWKIGEAPSATNESDKDESNIDEQIMNAIGGGDESGGTSDTSDESDDK
jgi:hypothetical protein